MKKGFLVLLFFTIFSMQSQEIIPYYEIPKMEENYSAANVVGRMIDGLGFRFYWSSNDLRPKDLAYQPEGEGRSSKETINHIFDLSTMMLRLTKIEMHQEKEKSEMTFTEIRKQTLLNFKALSNRIKASKDVSEFSVKKEGKVSIPFFNVINGPIADAIWHTGQLASFRRSSGNPINSKINHFYGTIKK